MTVGGRASEHVIAAESDPDVRRWHAAADVFLSPSRSEGMPFSIIEALADGVPVVASDVTTGHLAIGTDIPPYRLVPLTRDGVRRRRRGACSTGPADVAAAETEAGRAIMRERFDLQPWTERLMAIYDGGCSAEPLASRGRGSRRAALIAAAAGPAAAAPGRR